MAYQIPEKLKNMESYDPVTESFKVRLDANESFIDLPENIRQDILEAVKKVEFNRYPDPMARELCEKFGAFYHVNPELLTAGNGSDELISILTANFLEPGQTMLTLLPDFSMYGFYARCAGAKVESVNKQEDMVILADDVIERAKETDAKMIIFSNPCNPTSLKMDRQDILRIVESVDALVIADEAYMDFTSGSVLDEIENYENLIVLKTCSKAFGMASIRLGFAAANKRLTQILRSVKSPYNVNSLTQAAGCAVLSHREYLEECIVKIKKSTEELYESLKKLAEEKEEILRLYPTSTNFVYMKTKRGEEVFKELKKRSISIRFMNGYLRIAAGSEEENKELIKALEELLVTAHS